MSVCFGLEVSDDDQVPLGHGELLISYPEKHALSPAVVCTYKEL